MAKFSKYNNPNKKHYRKHISRTDADIIATKALLDDKINGEAKSLSYYDALSDKLSGNESRHLYD